MNFDEMAKEMFEPISVVIEKKVYTVKKVTAETFKMPETIGEDDVQAGGRQLAAMLGVDAGTFEHTDLRIVGRALKFVSDEIVKQMGVPVKNSPMAEGQPSG